MKLYAHNDNPRVTCINCITGKAGIFYFNGPALLNIDDTQEQHGDAPFSGPGLVDLQVNGINGIDFNDLTLTEAQVELATSYLLSKGITTYLPTVITNSDENIVSLLTTLRKACDNSELVKNCIYGIHLEGPFISAAEGARGAHDPAYIKAPDWQLFGRFQEAAGNKIKLVTIAPEWEGSTEFIQQCTGHGVMVAIGHSQANSEQVSLAVSAGACLSTHLGNGAPLQLPRHPNIIWDQLAAETLYAAIIADGIHLPDSFMKVVIKTKGRLTIVVSDATCFAGMPPGEYNNHIGGTVIVDNGKRVSLKSTPGMLAGAATNLTENVATLVNKNITTLGQAWQMASTNVCELLSRHSKGFVTPPNDLVIFRFAGNELVIEKVIKSGNIVG
jgi:N-acetylglucosamine-6-phosphate deacetylase